MTKAAIIHALTSGTTGASSARSGFGTDHSSFIIHHSSPRRGVTLMEVLISTFVLAVGLLGLMALIPAAQVTLLRTNKADRGGACGRVAQQEVKIRRMLEAFRPALDDAGQIVPMWLLVEGNGPNDYMGFNPNDYRTICIDPLGIATAAQRGAPDYSVEYMQTFPATDGTVNMITMPRVTLRAAPMTGAGPMNLALAEYVFRGRDDLQFAFPKDRTLRAEPAELDGDPSTLDPPEALGRYSWMVMLTPAASERFTPAAARQLFTVSIVVFFNRDPSMAVEEPAEQVFLVNRFLGMGIGGGSVQLDDKADVREGQWIMLCAREPVELAGTFQWYRVVSAGDVTVDDNGDLDPDGDPVTTLTLAGPDWDVGPDPVQAVVVRGVIGVYTKTVELNENSVWTSGQ